jgi:hypothetical protein
MLIFYDIYMTVVLFQWLNVDNLRIVETLRKYKIKLPPIDLLLTTRINSYVPTCKSIFE